ncbi:hypothetical protein [Paraburkholderia sp. PGU16]|jgi:hypothetical protein|uniref:Uncharacterized protein n=1 Tax=Paraburkholderia largidicola TaxID=3014751 RepID=A0A7I8BU27_9BURK|nr:hypothetical protein [Paraburkholderia sp. PGU16]BCF92297.1 hypothetical protein PPGU16_53640 [Paraburkholderia sp. PGU16]BEU23701.1 hypothetical protein PBP221_38410 [Paraburkholderia sp. 22B1P]GJH33594.1 hypothetical protein CBA19CS91_12575 [Paraburkholderia hospita]
MDFHPPFLVFCALGASVMIVSVLLAIAAEKIDNWLTLQTERVSSRRPVAVRHAETSHFL